LPAKTEIPTDEHVDVPPGFDAHCSELASALLPFWVNVASPPGGVVAAAAEPVESTRRAMTAAAVRADRKRGLVRSNTWDPPKGAAGSRSTASSTRSGSGCYRRADPDQRGMSTSSDDA
jgi:hypothetical protein